MLSLMAIIPVKTVYADANYLDLITGGTPMQIKYCHGQKMVHVALWGDYSINPNIGIAEINVTKVLLNEPNPYIIYEPNFTFYSFGSSIEYDNDNRSVWCIVSLEEYTFPVLVKFDTVTKTYTKTNIHCRNIRAPLICYKGFLWVPSPDFLLYKINTTTLTIVDNSSLPECNVRYMITDDNYIWMSALNGTNAGFVMRYNIDTNAIDLVIENLDNPFGLAVKDGKLYIASNTATYNVQGTIYVYNAITGTKITEIKTAKIDHQQHGPYMVYFDSNGILWWTDSSSHFGFISKFINQTYNAISPWCQYITEVEGQIWFTVKGSAHVGMVDEWREPDVNGDNKVDLKDVFAVALAYGSYPGTPKWNENYDFNKDEKIDLKDYYYVCMNYGKTW